MNVLPGDDVEEEDNVQRGTQVEATDDAVTRTSNASFEVSTLPLYQPFRNLFDQVD